MNAMFEADVHGSYTYTKRMVIHQKQRRVFVTNSYFLLKVTSPFSEESSSNASRIRMYGNSFRRIFSWKFLPQQLHILQ